ncbi:glutamate--tRNA ligase [Candidatus Gracilibacteria bacterium]|nr:glutamate--tRNA ligase [Candidatus Gracilibacteria bacterium]
MSFTEAQNKQIADLLFPEVTQTLADLEQRYPARQLSEGAIVTRIAPSPTGFMHIGLLYLALICARAAVQSKGVLMLRIEDTDQKRFVPGAIELIVDSLRDYEITIDEGPTSLESEVGEYGPYMQSRRASIYQICIKYLIEQGLAYPCWMNHEELERVSKEQAQSKIRPGIYGRFSKWRHVSADEMIAKLQSGEPYEVIRFRNSGSERVRRQVVDLVKGKLQLPENDNDIVLMKTSDGLPVYHLAHAVDDHFMRTTHVIRSDEWLPSMTLHHQLFEAFGWTVPQYAQIGPIDKLDNGNRRKLSKRKDPEANVQAYDQLGYPRDGVLEYLLNIANSNFEEWKKNHIDASYQEFEFKLSGLGKSGALLDTRKIENICKNIIGRMSSEHVYELALAWAQRHDQELATKMQAEKAYMLQIIGIERGGAEQRKDLAKWSDLRSEISFFFADWFEKGWNESSQAVIAENLATFSPEIIKAACEQMMVGYSPEDDKDTWITKLKAIAEGLGFAPDVKLFKQSPELYKGHFGDIAKIYRVYLTGKNRSPDLYWVMKILGTDTVKVRLQRGTQI